MNDFGFEPPGDRFGRSVVITVSRVADGWFNPGLDQSFVGAFKMRCVDGSYTASPFTI